MSVDICNTTSVPVKISEGAGGVYRVMGVIEPGKKYPLRVDKNSTYREYLLLALTEPENLPVGSSLTSDDVLEYSKIEIKEKETPGDGPVWIGIPNVKRRGVISRLMGGDPPVNIQIVNSLQNQSVEIVEQTAGPGPNTTGHTLLGETIPPGKNFPLPVDSVDPNDTLCYYDLITISCDNTSRPDKFTLGQVRSDVLKKLSKIEISQKRREYSWEGISSVRQGGSSVAN